VIRFIVDLLDSTLSLIPQTYQPDYLIGFHIPGLGVLLSLALLLATGMLATNYLGQRIVGWGELILSRIPLVRSIYSAVKQVLNTLLSTSKF